MQRMFKLGATAGLLTFTAGVLDSCLYDVDAGTRAVVMNLAVGVEDDVKGEGTHFKVPILQVRREGYLFMF